MENIYRVKIKTNPDPRYLYPSERRYSASIVLGMGVVHLALFGTSLLLTFLSLTVLKNHDPFTVSDNSNDVFKEITGENVNVSLSLDDTLINNTTEIPNVLDNIQNSNSTPLLLFLTQDAHQRLRENYMDNLVVAPSLVSAGALMAGLTALLAWKRWYVDQNIKWFFFASCISTITSAAALILLCLIVISTIENLVMHDSMTINIAIAAVLEFLWSVVSSKLAFTGMRRDYPDDIVISRSRGRVQVCNKYKGNKKIGKAVPPDILNHFPTNGKFAKFFPKKDSGNLPKEESYSEYQERVNRFLSSNDSSLPK